jgi:broad specificity phosphatase PhoE
VKLNVRRFVPGDEIPTRGILLIRHGPRTSPDIPPLSAMLTREGIAECVSLGTLIEKSPPNAIFSSPVQRCVETGVRIIEGANWTLEVKYSEMLGHPGPFVIGKINDEVNKLVAFAQENDDWSFLHKHVAGEEVPGMRNRMVGTNNLVDELYPYAEGYVLCISHDSIIAAITAALDLNPEPWPEPLEGLVIEKL